MTPAQERVRAKRLADYFRLTPEEWQRISDHQGHVCFFCGEVPSVGRLNTDHDHSTGLIRGLLCRRCNRVFGKIENGRFTDDMLRRVIMFRQNPPATVALGEPRYGLPGRIGTKKQKKLIKKLKDAGVFNAALNTPIAA